MRGNTRRCQAENPLIALSSFLEPALAVTYRDPLHRRLQPFRYLHDCSGCFRLERSGRVGLAPTEKRRLVTAHTHSGHSRRSKNQDVSNTRSLSNRKPTVQEIAFWEKSRYLSAQFCHRLASDRPLLAKITQIAESSAMLPCFRKVCRM